MSHQIKETKEVVRELRKFVAFVYFDHPDTGAPAVEYQLAEYLDGAVVKRFPLDRIKDESAVSAIVSGLRTALERVESSRAEEVALKSSEDRSPVEAQLVEFYAAESSEVK